MERLLGSAPLRACALAAPPLVCLAHCRVRHLLRLSATRGAAPVVLPAVRASPHSSSPQASPCCSQAPKPFAAAKSLGSVANGIAAAPRPTLAVQLQQQQQPASLALEVVCADGPRGMKLKTRKARRVLLAGQRRGAGHSGTAAAWNDACGELGGAAPPALPLMLPLRRLPYTSCSLPPSATSSPAPAR